MPSTDIIGWWGVGALWGPLNPGDIATSECTDHSESFCFGSKPAKLYVSGGKGSGVVMVVVDLMSG